MLRRLSVDHIGHCSSIANCTPCASKMKQYGSYELNSSSLSHITSLLKYEPNAHTPGFDIMPREEFVGWMISIMPSKLNQWQRSIWEGLFNNTQCYKIRSSNELCEEWWTMVLMTDSALTFLSFSFFTELFNSHRWRWERAEDEAKENTRDERRKCHMTAQGSPI